MRKRYRINRRSCGLCKPHKRGLTNRWKPRDLALLRAAEADVSAQRRSDCQREAPSRTDEIDPPVSGSLR